MYRRKALARCRNEHRKKYRIVIDRTYSEKTKPSLRKRPWTITGDMWKTIDAWGQGLRAERGEEDDENVFDCVSLTPDPVVATETKDFDDAKMAQYLQDLYDAEEEVVKGGDDDVYFMIPSEGTVPRMNYRSATAADHLFQKIHFLAASASTVLSQQMSVAPLEEFGLVDGPECFVFPMKPKSPTPTQVARYVMSILLSSKLLSY